ncbi:MAG: hypothetical protein KDF65_03055, partial [Anaerolineae bacterium]|nr:hypothetical protein [Anaerolineae bacterium]
YLQNSESFTIHFESVEQVELNVRVAGTIFSIIQEAINNVKRHAGARNVWLTLEQRKQQLVVGVRDDGSGFAVEAVTQNYEQRGSLGLLNMRERAELIEAELRLESRLEPPNRGTTVQVILPMLSNSATEKEKST